MPLDGGSACRYEAFSEIEAIIRLLSHENKWCKKALSVGSDRLCILGAILQVHSGRASLTEPILKAIHEVTGRRYRRIEAFNDDPATTHALVVEVLRQAREIILGGLIGTTLHVDRQ